MFRYDAKAQEIALEAIQQGFDLAIAPAERLFFYFALEHAEDIERVRQAVALKARLIEDSPLPQRQRFERMHQSALQHLEILAAFGRYPHRNALLGRQHNGRISYEKMPALACHAEIRYKDPSFRHKQRAFDGPWLRWLVSIKRLEAP